MTLLKLIFLLSGVFLIYACQHPNKSRDDGKKSSYILEDSLFFKNFNLTTKLKLPITFKYSQKSLFDYRNRSHHKIDSLFQYKYLSDYDNSELASSLQNYYAQKMNDSIYIIIYYGSEVGGTEFDIMLASFNVNVSEKPVDKLILYRLRKGEFVSESMIDADFNIQTINNRFMPPSKHILHHLGLEDSFSYGMKAGEPPCYAQLTIRKYRILPDGKLQIYYFASGRSEARRTKEGNFEFQDSTDINISQSWKLVNGKQVYEEKSYKASFDKEGKLIIRGE